MAEKAVFTMRLDAQLRADFRAAAEAADRPASQAVRELMDDFVKRQREARDYDLVLQDKVTAVRESLRTQSGVSNDEAEALFTQHRREVAARPEVRLLIGEALQAIGRKHDITSADLAAIEQARTGRSVEPIQFGRNSL